MVLLFLKSLSTTLPHVRVSMSSVYLNCTKLNIEHWRSRRMVPMNRLLDALFVCSGTMLDAILECLALVDTSAPFPEGDSLNQMWGEAAMWKQHRQPRSPHPILSCLLSLLLLCQYKNWLSRKDMWINLQGKQSKHN